MSYFGSTEQNQRQYVKAHKAKNDKHTTTY